MDGEGITIPTQMLLWLGFAALGCAATLAILHSADRDKIKPQPSPILDVLRYVIGDAAILFWVWVFALGSGQLIAGVSLTVILCVGGLVVILLHGLGGVKQSSQSAKHEGALLTKVEQMGEEIARLQAQLLGGKNGQ